MKLTVTSDGRRIGELDSSIVPRVGEYLEVIGTAYRVEAVTYRFNPKTGSDDDLAEIVLRVS